MKASVLATPRFEQRDHDRFMAFVEVEGEHWIWTGATSRSGDNPSFWSGTQVPAARWLHAYNHDFDWDDDRLVQVRCEVPRCVAPSHTEVRTRQQVQAEAGVARRKTTRQKLLDNSQVDEATGCWLWLGVITNQGYGLLKIRDEEGKYKNRLAHRIAHVEFIGPIPDGHEVDHTCCDPEVCAGGTEDRHRACINPEHLESVTKAVNILRANPPRTHCKYGHDLTDPDNIYRYPDPKSLRGERIYCRVCQRNRDRTRARRKRQAKATA